MFRWMLGEFHTHQHATNVVINKQKKTNTLFIRNFLDIRCNAVPSRPFLSILSPNFLSLLSLSLILIFPTEPSRTTITPISLPYLARIHTIHLRLFLHGSAASGGTQRWLHYHRLCRRRLSEIHSHTVSHQNLSTRRRPIHRRCYLLERRRINVHRLEPYRLRQRLAS